MPSLCFHYIAGQYVKISYSKLKLFTYQFEAETCLERCIMFILTFWNFHLHTTEFFFIYGFHFNPVINQYWLNRWAYFLEYECRQQHVCWLGNDSIMGSIELWKTILSLKDFDAQAKFGSIPTNYQSTLSNLNNVSFLHRE